MSTPPPPSKPDAPPARRCPSWLGRGVLYVLALLFLFLGILGAFIPGMPTTVFILMSAWAAARSSPRLHEWLRQHRLFGPSLRNWEAGGYVSRKGKRMAALTMLACTLIMVLVGVPLWALITASSCMAIVGTWLWFRPEPPEHLTRKTRPR